MPAQQVQRTGVRIPEQTAPATPPSGFGDIYFKTDSLPYAKNDVGTEMLLFRDVDDIEFVAMWGAFS